MIGRRLHLTGKTRPGLLLLLEGRLGIFLLRILRMGKRLLVLVHSQISFRRRTADQLSWPSAVRMRLLGFRSRRLGIARLGQAAVKAIAVAVEIRLRGFLALGLGIEFVVQIL